jgi:hypothetical protein
MTLGELREHLKTDHGFDAVQTIRSKVYLVGYHDGVHGKAGSEELTFLHGHKLKKEAG